MIDKYIKSRTYKVISREFISIVFERIAWWEIFL